jgi:diacylglycerol kinase (ATP)
MKSSKHGILKAFRALKYSYDGLLATIKSEEAFRQEMFLAILLIPGAFLLNVFWLERMLMISAVLIIILAELINSAIEAIVDRISMTKHPLSKKAKDIGSALVFISFVNAAVIWGTILIK